MPEIMRHVAERLGVDAAVRLIEEPGGKAVCVPPKVRGSPLAELVGIEIATVLCEEWPGIRIDISNGGIWRAQNWRAHKRSFAVLSSPRKSTNELADEFGITARHVRNIRAAHRRSVVINAKPRRQAKENSQCPIISACIPWWCIPRSVNSTERFTRVGRGHGFSRREAPCRFFPWPREPTCRTGTIGSSGN